MRRKAEQMASRSEAVGKMLRVLGLRMIRRRWNHKIRGVLDKKNGMVRSFKIVENGKEFLWLNDNPARPHLGLPGNGISFGAWTIFKDTDDATFSLFTEKMKCFTCESHNPSARVFHQNPFYGCKSVEEVLVKCDLLREKA